MLRRGHHTTHLVWQAEHVIHPRVYLPDESSVKNQIEKPKSEHWQLTDNRQGFRSVSIGQTE